MPASERNSHWLKLLVLVAVSVIFSAYFLLSIDLGDVVDALEGANYAYVVPGLALFGVSVVFRSLRWSVFLAPNHELSTKRLLPSVLIGYAGNNLLPLRAGELVRAEYLYEHFEVPRMRTFGVLLMERLFDGLVLATFVLWGLLLVDSGAAYLTIGLLLLAGTLTGFVFCTAVANRPGLLTTFGRLRVPFLGDAIHAQIAALGGSFLTGFTVLTSPRRFGMAMVATVGAWGMELAMYWFVARAFDLDASLITIAFAGAAANVGLSVPLAQGGVGAFQILATEALVKSGVAQAAAAAYALALHFFLIVPVSLVGLVVLWRKTLPSASRGSRPRVVEPE
ncbi:MAG: lysylphosphatidylglycerol synthase transmembrane domain-containing protein [Dehalococcoidia bacterium]